MKCNLLLLTLITHVFANAQEYKYQGARIILATNETNQSSMYVYSPPFQAKAIFKDTLAATNLYPEQLMESIISANSQEWIDYNTLGGEERSKKYDKKYFEKRSALDKEKTFLELKSKYTFIFEGNEMAIIKYYYNSQDNKPISGAYVMQKLNNRWFYTSTAFTSDLAFVIMRFQDEKLAQILSGQKTDDAIINDVINKIKDKNGNIRTDKLVNEFNNWYTNNSKLLNYFKDPNAW